MTRPVNFKVKKSLFSLLIFSTLWLAPHAQADFLLHPWEDHHQDFRLAQVSAEFLYYDSTNNYDPNGSTYNPSGLNSYNRANFDFGGTYGFSKQFSGYARLSWEMAKVNTSNTASFGGTTWGFGDQVVGANYRLNEKENGSSIALQFQAEIPVYAGNNSASPLTSPVLGDASLNLTAGGIFNFPLGWRANASNDILFSVAGGFTYRTAGYSSSFPYSVKLSIHPRQEGFMAQVMAFGDFSLKTDSNDTNSNLVYNSLATSFNSGGSYVTGGINTSLATARGEVGYVTPADYTFSVSLSQSFYGRSAPEGFTVGFGISTHMGRNISSDPAYQSPDQYRKSNKGYVDYNLDAKVIRANDHFNLIKIDKGANDGVNVGDVFDIFIAKPNGSVGAAIARGQVTNTKATESAVKIQEYFKEVWIDEGFIARRALN